MTSWALVLSASYSITLNLFLTFFSDPNILSELQKVQVLFSLFAPLLLVGLLPPGAFCRAFEPMKDEVWR